jgi:hypothetical protein
LYLAHGEAVGQPSTLHHHPSLAQWRAIVPSFSALALQANLKLPRCETDTAETVALLSLLLALRSLACEDLWASWRLLLFGTLQATQNGGYEPKVILQHAAGNDAQYGQGQHVQETGLSLRRNHGGEKGRHGAAHKTR